MTETLAPVGIFSLMMGPSSGGRAMTHGNAATDDLDRRLAALMSAAQAGDKPAYAALLRDCEPFIRQVGRRAGVMDDRLNDVVQDTLLTLHKARQTYDPARSFLAWLRVITQRRAVDILRKHGRGDRREIHAPLVYEDHADPGAGPSDGLDQGDRAKRLDAALAKLSAGQREAVERLALREQTLSEAAAETGKTAGALKVNFHRALKALRLQLGSDEDHV